MNASLYLSKPGSFHFFPVKKNILTEYKNIRYLTKYLNVLSSSFV